MPLVFDVRAEFPFDPERTQFMWKSLRFAMRRIRHNRHSHRATLERLEERRLLAYADFELSSLLPGNGGDGSKGFVINGTVGQGKLGYPSYGYHSLGDVNQDGLDDMLIAATGAGASPAITSHVYLVFGQAGGFPASFDLNTLNGTAGYVFDGMEVGDRAGIGSGGVGDVNNDGIRDFAILANGQTSLGDDLTGDRTIVVYGGAAHLASLDLADGAQDGHISLSAINGADGFVINGIVAPGVPGSRLFTQINGVGDINGDHVDDLVVGNGYQDSIAGPGKVFVVFGRDSSAGHFFPATVELASLNGSNGFVIPGIGAKDALGQSVGGGGDVNGDGIEDLVLGAMYASPAGRASAGQAYVIFGRTSFPASFNLATLNGTNGFTVHGAMANDYLGGYTSDVAGDINGDGVDDLLLTAWGVDVGSSSVGAAYILFGKQTGSFPAVLDLATLNGTKGVAIRGVSSGDYVGRASRAGDVNGDGYDDILIGAGNADPNGITDAGQSYIVYGRPSFGATFDLASLLAANGGDGSSGVALNGYAALGAGAGGFVAGIGDINGDGYDDIRISATLVDSNGLTDNGQVYIVYGKPSPSPTKFYVVDDATPDRTYEYAASGSANENYGLGSGNTSPRGAASTAAGDKVWVVDANKKVYVYNTAGTLLGSWTAGSLASNAVVEGIATNGTDVWIVDAQQDKVFRYSGAASRLSGSQNAASSFSLNSGNTGPKDIVTDGSNLWVINDAAADKVFKYTLTGSLVGSWTITGAGSAPTGITLDPSGGGQLWIVDNGTDRVYQFDNARSRSSGSQSPSLSFALAAGNANPQGIADPPARTSIASQTERLAHHSRVSVAIDRSSRRAVALAAQSPLFEQDLIGLATELARANAKRIKSVRRI